MKLIWEQEGDETVDMCQAIQEMWIESERNVELKKAHEAAKNFYAMGVEIEKIAQGLDQTVETIRQWLGLTANEQ